MIGTPPCDLAETFAKDWLLRTAIGLETLVNLVTIILLIIFVWRRKSMRIAVHRNIKIILLNIMVLYALASVNSVQAYARYLTTFLTYREPCDLLVSSTEIAFVRGIGYLYLISFPVWHMTLSIERALATMRPAAYEKSKATYGAVASVFVWLYTFCFVSTLLYLAYQDETFRTGSAYSQMSTPTNARLILLSNYIAFSLAALSLILDAATALVNKRRRKRISEGYTLNQSYQVKENIDVTLRLILPLDLCNASLLIIASSIGILIREHRTVLEPHVSMALLEMDTIFVWLQPPISLLIFMRFCRSSKYTAVVTGQQSETDAYFAQFEKQLDAMYDKKHLA